MKKRPTRPSPSVLAALSVLTEPGMTLTRQGGAWRFCHAGSVLPDAGTVHGTTATALRARKLVEPGPGRVGPPYHYVLTPAGRALLRSKAGTKGAA